MTKIAAMPIDRKTSKNILLQSHWADCNEIWYVGSRIMAHHTLFKLRLWADRDLFYAKVRFGHFKPLYGKKMKII